MQSGINVWFPFHALLWQLIRQEKSRESKKTNTPRQKVNENA